MSNHVANREKAIKIAQDACRADTSKNYDEAYRLYKLAVKHFLFVIRYETNPTLKSNLEDKVDEYIKRCEQIKEFLDTKDVQKPVLNTANGEPDEEKKDVNSGLRS